MTMTLVSTVTVGAGGAASIEFTSIPQTGTDLLLVFSTRVDSTPINPQIQFNSDTASNYTRRLLDGDGSTVNSSSSTSTSLLGLNCTTAHTANTFSSNNVYVTNYTGSSGKSVSIDAITENNATLGYQRIAAGLWSGTAGISSIKIFTSGANFVQYSTASLYTITKGSGGATVS